MKLSLRELTQYVSQNHMAYSTTSQNIALLYSCKSLKREYGNIVLMPLGELRL